MFRLAEQRLKMRRWHIGRYSLTQLLNALDFSDTSDPHAGNIALNSLDDLADL